MAALGEYETLADKYSRRGIHFILIYVEEAHAIGTGDFLADSGYLQMKQSTTIEERLCNATVLKEHTKIPVYVDTIDNQGENVYGAHPERLYVIKDGVIAMKGGEGPIKYSIEDVVDWIENK